MFAESAGKKGGDFYTPRDVIRLMVRVLNPAPGMVIYDPCCGSGGMLIISREYIEQSGGDPTNLRMVDLQAEYAPSRDPGCGYPARGYPAPPHAPG